MIEDAAMIFTCDDCADDYFPGRPPPTVSEIREKASRFSLADPGFGTVEPGDPDPHVCIAHAGCAGDFMSGGFDVEPASVAEPMGLYCPHLPT
jgi:hypothetical protein